MTYEIVRYIRQMQSEADRIHKDRGLDPVLKELVLQYVGSDRGAISRASQMYPALYSVTDLTSARQGQSQSIRDGSESYVSHGACACYPERVRIYES